jgi:hypothetical protein
VAIATKPRDENMIPGVFLLFVKKNMPKGKSTMPSVINPSARGFMSYSPISFFAIRLIPSDLCTSRSGKVVVS